MDWSLILVILAVVFLVGHILLDVRTIAKTVAHPRDFYWTAATLFALGGHLILDFINGA